MNRDKRKNIVYDAIKNHPDKGMNQIWKIIQTKYDSAMSKPTFLKMVRLLNEEKKISVVKGKNRQRSMLTTNIASFNVEKKALRSFRKESRLLRKRLDYYDAHKKEFTEEQKTNLLVLAQKILWILRWKLQNDIIKLENTPEFKKQSSQIEGLEIDLFSYFLEYPDYVRIWDQANSQYVKEHFEMTAKMDSILKSK